MDQNTLSEPQQDGASYPPLLQALLKSKFLFTETQLFYPLIQ